MRRFVPPAQRSSALVRLFFGAIIAVGVALVTIQAQIPGRNVNMVAGTTWPEGDPFLQRQNEPSVAASTRNPLHLLGGSNDYRTVDVPGLPDGQETGDAWLGLFKSVDGGQRWTSTLLPGYPQDQSPAGLASPLKNYQAGADAVVRAGTNGLLYYSGLVFDRAEDGKSGVFLARFIDNNSQEAGDPIAYLGTRLVAASNGAKFLDKPWLAVDIPRSNAATCTATADDILATAQNGRRRRNGYDRHEWGYSNIRGRGGRPSPAPPSPPVQRIPAGAIYVAYSSITGDATTLRSEILLTRSMDCGNTWSAPIKVSRPEDAVNQGSSITIDPRTGAVYVGWRRFDPDLTDASDLDAIMVARLPFGAGRFDAATPAHRFRRPERKVGRKLHRLFEHRANRFKDVPSSEATETLDQFDLGTTGFNFRTNAYPTMAADGTGRVYLAWTQRGFAADSGVADGARIVVATTRDGRNFSSPQPVDDHSTPGRGHQLMPSMAFAGGKLMMVFYDLRDTKAQTFNRIASDFNTLTGLRQTIDIRSAMASPGDTPVFEASTRVSDYQMGFNPASGEVEELQVNPPNLPMFKLGTVPFMGDYIDVTAAPAFVKARNGRWEYNTASGGQLPVFHAVWTDNRDVRPPRNGEWWNYTPARMSPGQLPSNSIFDPTQPVPQCVDGAGNPGSRNQNVYSARITGGLLAGSPGNAKPLSPDLQRAFVVFAQNTSTETTSFRMTILNQPPGGRASFDQFPAPPFVGTPPPPETAIEMIVPPRSTASRTVYATSTDPNAPINVAVAELVDLRTLASPALYPDAPEKAGGLETLVVINPDIENPDIENPDIENPDIENPDIENAEVYNLDIANPDIENPDIENPAVKNPDIENPDIENPDIENPDIENVRVANPDIENPDIENPDIENPDIENPDIENPDIENPDIENGAIADITWKVTNVGNTTSAFNVNLFLAEQQLPAGLKTQLILLKTYRTPATVANGCQLGFQTRNVLLANIRNPILVPPGGGTANANDPAETNATLWLAPGEEGRIVLRVIDDDTSNNVPITKPNGEIEYVDPALVPTDKVSPGVQPQGVGTEDAGAGLTDPPIVTPSGSNLFFLQMPTTAAPGTPVAPPVRVQVLDLAGAPVEGATVTLSLGTPVLDAALSGNLAATGVDGIAAFPLLTVSTPGLGLTLIATAAIPGGVASGVSLPFDISTGATTVVTTADSGPGSLRAAILAANSTPGPDTITFNINGPSAPVIAVQTPLPALSSFTTIDGRTQPGYDNSPIVELTWAGGAVTANGFTIAFDQTGVQILGLAITGFPAFGIQSLQADSPDGGGHQIRFNTIGTDRFSSGGKGNQIGIEMRTDDAVIDSNVISGSNSVGILVVNDADRVLITGNRIGTSVDGLSALPNDSGIRMYDSLNDIEIASNLISGNVEYGIDIQDSEAGDVTGTRIVANRVGVSDDGSALGNGDGGVRINNAPGTIIGTPGAGGNIISANGRIGLEVHGAASTGVVIQGNRIGSDPTGTAPRGNAGVGVQITTSGVEFGWRAGDPTLPTAGNLIAGNGGDGLQLLGEGATGNRVRGNRIGTNVEGTAALGTAVAALSNFQGIYVTGSTNVIGGLLPEERNLLSGNVIDGVYVHGATATGNVIQGNFIGTDASGAAAIANGFEGVGLIDAPGNTVTGNLVSGNARYGFYVTGDDNAIAGNTIGAADGGSAPLGNQGGGVYIAANNTQVGVASPNVIAFNTGNGVTIASGTGNEIANNGIRANTAMGIDLAGNGVTLNDAGDGDMGANTQQNFPVLANPRNPVAADTMVDFKTTSFATGLYTLRFFAGACDTNGHGEGARLVGVITAIPNGIGGTITLTEVVPIGEAVTATATDAAGNTSEFSACATVAAPAAIATITSVSPNPSAAGFGQHLYIRGTNLAGVNAANVILNFAGGDGIAQNIWHISPTLVVARFVLRTPVGPASIRIKSPDGLTVSNSFPITLQAIPGAPIMTAISTGCGGSGFLSAINSDSTIYVSAEGTDTTGATVVFTPTAPPGPAIEVPVTTTCGGGGNAYMSSQVTVPSFPLPAGLPITVSVQIKTQVGANTSPLSNAHSLTVNPAQ